MGKTTKAIIRVVLLILILIATSVYWYSRIDTIRASYQTVEQLPKSEPENSRSKDATEEMGHGDSKVSRWKDAAKEMRNQNQLLINWGALLLAGITALVATSTVHAIPKLEWIYLLLAPAGSLLLGSLWAGVIFQRRLTYLILKDDIESIGSLNSLLTAQAELLQWGVIPLAILALVFLIGIVWGSVTPSEAR